MATPRARVHDVLWRFAASPRIAPLLAVYRGAPTVKPSARLAFCELMHRHDLAYYRVRENGFDVAIRHGAAAVWVLAEIFNRHCYEPRTEAAKVLGEPRTILDLGANIGLFGLFAAGRWPQAEVVGFEPDRANAALHELTIGVNDLSHRWQLVEAAASTRDGRTAFVGGHNAVSHMVDETPPGELAVEVATVDVLPRIAEADLVKMDIEGGEWAILADPRFREAPPTAMVLEFHPDRCPAAEPREAAERAFGEAEMQVEVAEDRGDGHGVVWAWRA